MLFFKLVIAAVLVVTVSTTPAQKDLTLTGAVRQRRAMAVNLPEKSLPGRDKCGACDPDECQSFSSGCKEAGCCHRSE
ncbi:secreted protein [Melampsora americana]|nr:secreted protein [Melampsora americana]